MLGVMLIGGENPLTFILWHIYFVRHLSVKSHIWFINYYISILDKTEHRCVLGVQSHGHFSKAKLWYSCNKT